MDLATLTTILTLSTTPDLPAPKPRPQPEQYTSSFVQPGLNDHQRYDLSAKHNPILEAYQN